MRNRDLEIADITAIYNFHAKAAVSIINERDQDLMPQLVMVRMNDEPGHIGEVMLADPGLVNALQRTHHSKQVLMTIVRLLLNSGETAPDAVVHVSEAWAVESSRGSRDAQGLLDGHEGVKDHPNRTEALMVNIHTRARSYTGMCPIESDGKKRRAVFKPLDTTCLVTGRLFIEPEATAH